MEESKLDWENIRHQILEIQYAKNSYSNYCFDPDSHVELVFDRLFRNLLNDGK